MAENNANKRILIIFIKMFFVVFIVATLLSKSFVNWTLPRVRAETLSGGNITWEGYGTGKVEFKEYEEVYSDMEGAVNTVKVKVGDKVKKGQVIATLDKEILEEEIATLNTLLETQENNKKIMEIDRKRYEEYSNALSSGESNYYKGELEKIDITLENKDLEIKEIEEKIKKLEDKIKNTEIKAPEEGVVMKVDCSKGSMVNINESICLILKDNSKYLIKTNVVKEYDKYITEGDEVEVVVEGNKLDAIVTNKNLVNDKLESEMLEVELDIISDLREDINEKEAEITFKKDQGDFKYVIDKALLRQNNDNYFILTLKQEQGVFGIKYYVRQEKVNILSDNGIKVAIEPVRIGSNKQIIYYSSKYIEKNDRVFLEE